MKRSHAILLSATGIVLAAGYFVGGGKQRLDEGEKPADARIYASLDECMKAHQGWGAPLPPSGGPAPLSAGQADCQRDFAEATQKHVQTAPKFTSQSDCEAQYGSAQCRPATFNGTSVFVPAMIGFMVANALNNARNPQALMPPLRGSTQCQPGQTPETQPGCTAPPRSGTSSGSSGRSSSWSSFSTASGHTVSRDMNKPANQSVPVPGSAAAAPAARSSLGAVAARPSSFTRSSSSSYSSSSTSRSGFGSTGRSISSSSS